MAEDAALVEATDPTVEDLLNELPVVRERVMRETYGDTVVDELARRHTEAPAHAEMPSAPTPARETPFQCRGSGRRAGLAER